LYSYVIDTLRNFEMENHFLVLAAIEHGIICT